MRPRALARAGLLLLPALWLGGCASERSQVLAVTPVQGAVQPPPAGAPRPAVAIGRFDNRSGFQRGAFSDGSDRLGGQARAVLTAHLQQSQRFRVQDRDNTAEAQAEARLRGEATALQAARFLVTGDVTEFGRRETGDRQLFGILGHGKQQTAYAKVTLNVVDSRNGEVVYAAQGAGEVSLSNREIVGFGGTAGYDATLNGKVLDLAIREAVNALVSGLDGGRWAPGPGRP